MVVEGAVFSKIHNLATIQPRAILSWSTKSDSGYLIYKKFKQ